LQSSDDVAPVLAAPLPSRTAWVVVALLWGAAMLNYLDRQLIATMSGPIEADVHSSTPASACSSPSSSGRTAWSARSPGSSPTGSGASG